MDAVSFQSDASCGKLRATPAVGGSAASDAGKPPTRRRAWLPLAAKVVASGVGVCGLAGLGAWSMLQHVPGSLSAERLDPAALQELARGSEWVAKNPTSSPSPTTSLVSGLTHPHASARVERTKPAPPAGVTEDGRIILNQAEAKVLTRLPGVGQKRAVAIVSLRKRLGRFRRINDLLRVRGIGVRSLRRMKPMLVLDAPKEKDKQAGKKE